MIRRTSLFTIAFAFVLAAVACDKFIGNSSSSCGKGETCKCDGIGNCERSCPEGRNLRRSRQAGAPVSRG